MCDGTDAIAEIRMEIPLSNIYSTLIKCIAVVILNANANQQAKPINSAAKNQSTLKKERGILLLLVQVSALRIYGLLLTEYFHWC